MRVLTLFLIILMAQSCDNTMEELKALNANETMELLFLSVDEYDTFDDNKEYIEYKEVIGKIELKGDTKAELIQAILSKDNYEPLSRKCKLDPVYALKINGELFALLDVEYCPLLKVNSSNELLQITFDNSIKQRITEIYKND